MDNETEVKRLYRRILTVHFSISSLYASLESLLEDDDTESLKTLSDDIDFLESSVNNLKSDLLLLLQKMAGETNDVSGEKTKNGIKL